MEVITAPASERNPQSATGPLPAGLDPVASPIIALHFYGWQRLGGEVSRVVQRIPPPECEP